MKYTEKLWAVRCDDGWIAPDAGTLICKRLSSLYLFRTKAEIDATLALEPDDRIVRVTVTYEVEP